MGEVADYKSCLIYRMKGRRVGILDPSALSSAFSESTIDSLHSSSILISTQNILNHLVKEIKKQYLDLNITVDLLVFLKVIINQYLKEKQYQQPITVLDTDCDSTTIKEIAHIVSITLACSKVNEVAPILW